MPSPFPGMDPFVESPTHWSDFHPTFIGALREAINRVLPPGYRARLDERVMMINPEMAPPARKVMPDVLVTSNPSMGGSKGLSGGALTLDPTTIENVELSDPVTETFIEIVRLPEHDAITMVELLSPTNKYGEGRGIYLDKRQRLLRSPVNMVEIDLIRAGPRLELGRPLPPDHYYCFVSRGDRRPWCDVFHWSMRNKLPPIPIPLRSGDADVVVDLEEPFAVAFERGGYDQFIDYSQPVPPPALSDKDANWVKDVAKSVAK
jgi:Protein of unknown function (DUF4058)